jgi:hypothetical protein
MRTVHETEALRPSDPVPKHHSSNPSNNKQRLKLILNAGDGKKPEKGSTPASPSSHSHPTIAPPPPDVDYAHNNVIYLQDLAIPNAPTMVQFPPDITFTDRELAMPAPDLFQYLRRHFQFVQQESDELRAQADLLEKQRKEEWEAKELLFENLMEAQVATERRERADRGEPEDEAFDAVAHDAIPARALPIKPKNGKLPWWREGMEMNRRLDLLEAAEAQQDARPPPGDIRREEPDARAPPGDMRLEDVR